MWRLSALQAAIANAEAAMVDQLVGKIKGDRNDLGYRQDLKRPLPKMCANKYINVLSFDAMVFRCDATAAW